MIINIFASVNDNKTSAKRRMWSNCLLGCAQKEVPRVDDATVDAANQIIPVKKPTRIVGAADDNGSLVGGDGVGEGVRESKAVPFKFICLRS